ncbi:conserved protein, unknown function [Plasmodium knowlesi strain H]|uniref:THH1/TOM1/TOM3 domain-containing protein n=2 Tax=Plasmodium knowlesi TaxID=5850 RepID=B3L395_PLAKH|nr:conserved protein, unknown function [Plasmodium knowlesi strain H]OTN67515.1 Uncharacterized protein PKNOH_S06407800 [Plasmodium knowlesi]CAA9987353.1 conserved protein, unknown function [Plasmodium knowlesi strain H]VVS76827.1 conserved protein, unknown function [Plasmodium knowlesi strain H]|eukprot:XP_002258356.1 hypothetical protein, conserved in Plasmodium species [Plasmodium knowlesi strain H]
MTTGIYFLILLIFFYAYLSYLLYQLLIRNRKVSPVASANLTGEKTRNFLFVFLFFCHISRIISLTILTYLDIRYYVIDYNTLLLFPNFYFYLIILKAIPTYFFLSSFTIIILFWSQVYYASILVSAPHLQSLYIFLNGLVYAINIILASLSYFTQAFYNYIYYNYILESIIDYIIAIAFLYYGVKVTKKLEEKSKGISKNNSIIKRILSLAIIMFVILALKGLYSFWCFVKDENFYNSYFDLPTCDAISYFISECIPSLLIIYTFQSNKGKNSMNFDYTTPLCADTFDPYNLKSQKKKAKKKTNV